MRNILLAIFCFAESVAFAQNKFFIQPQLGIGEGKVKNSISYDPKSVLIFDMPVGFGFQHKHWLLTTGIGYLETGFKETLYGGRWTSVMDQRIYFNHIISPFTVGYELTLGKKISVIPAIGIAGTYNISGRATSVISSKIEPIPTDTFSKYYRPFSAFGVVQLGIECYMSKKMSITFTPVYEFMFTNIMKGGPVYYQRNKALLFNTGIKWYFERKKKEK